MWEIIESNKRKSVVLLAVMAVLMIGVGMVIGESYAPGGWVPGALIASVIWAVLSLISYYSGDAIFLASSGAKEIQRDDHPTLYNIVEEMKIASGLTNMPRVYIIDDPRPNAFATGRDPEHASVAVTAGLLNRLNRDEVQGVVAHEMAHIQNRDILYVMMAAVMIGVIAIMSDLFLRSLRFGGGRHRSRSSKGGGQAQAVIMILAILFAILGPIAAQMLYFALSRRREYLADACGAQFTRYPEGLASALEKISRDPGLGENKNRAMAPMYIINPMMAASLGSTHPPTSERIRILRSMGGASIADYEQAYQRAKNQGLIPSSALKQSIPVGVRPAWQQAEAASQQKAQSTRTEQMSRARETSDALWRVQNYAFIDCACGAKLKVPPAFKSAKVRCPRCERIHDVPQA